jgi:hypothetical protein
MVEGGSFQRRQLRADRVGNPLAYEPNTRIATFVPALTAWVRHSAGSGAAQQNIVYCTSSIVTKAVCAATSHRIVAEAADEPLSVGERCGLSFYQCWNCQCRNLL